MKRWWPYLLFLGALVGYLLWRFPYALESDDDTFHLVYKVVLLVALGSGLIVSDALNWGRKFKYLFIWALIIAALMVAYSYRDVFLNTRAAAALFPSQIQAQEDGTLTVRRSLGDHFYIEAMVNDTPVRFMVDTGASETVLSAADAKRAHIHVEDLQFTRVYSTANGTVGGAPVTLKQFSIGPIEVKDFEVSVNDGEMQGSLLGMSFLSLLRSYRVEGDTLTLVP